MFVTGLVDLLLSLIVVLGIVAVIGIIVIVVHSFILTMKVEKEKREKGE